MGIRGAILTVGATALVRHIAEVDDELIHTERRQMRHELAVDVDRLRLIQKQLARLLTAAQ